MVDITHDMTDDGFHEIQLSGKQLVFLFMATTFVSILIFLCGVLVGRGVRSERETADATVAARAITSPTLASAPAAAPAAAAIVQRLSAKGYPAFIVNPSASASSQVFKVQVGRYNDRSEADRVSKRLEKEEKFNPWISR